MSDLSRPPAVSSHKRTWASFALIVAVTAIVVGIPLFTAGFAFGYVRARVERGDADVSVVEEVTESDPENYSSLTINRGPLDKFHLEGTVSTNEALEFLRSEMVRSFGEYRAEYILEVTVDEAPGG